MRTIYNYRLTLIHNADRYRVKHVNGDSVEVLMHLGSFVKGDDGRSAYQVAVDNGFEGTEAEWLASLKGRDGRDAQTSALSCDDIDLIWNDIMQE
jgi:hypothetical protein